jgi:4-carboxymuconolactone decarboxylase
MKSLFFAIIILTFTCLATDSKGQRKMSNTPQLDSKQQSIVRISALTATGDIEQLKVQLNKGLDSGLTVNEIKEVLVQLYAYCGFPRSLNGIVAFMAVIDERKAKGIHNPEGKVASPLNDTDKYRTGKKTLQALTGREEKDLTGANAFAPVIDIFLKEHLFADIFSRDVLTYEQRELVTVSALAAMSGVEPQLQAHIGMAMNTGLTEPQFSEAFRIIGKVVSKTQEEIANESLAKVVTAKKQ